MGRVRFYIDLIEWWQRNFEDRLNTWNISVCFALNQVHHNQRWEELQIYRKHFRESRSYLAYIKNHKNHEKDFDFMVTRIEGFDYFKKTDFKDLEKQKADKKDNLFKKVKFY